MKNSNYSNLLIHSQQRTFYQNIFFFEISNPRKMRIPVICVMLIELDYSVYYRHIRPKMHIMIYFKGSKYQQPAIFMLRTIYETAVIVATIPVVGKDSSDMKKNIK